MSRARNLADLLDSNGDVVSGALDNVPPSNDASALTTGTLPIARIADGDITGAKLANDAKVVKSATAPASPSAGDLWYDSTNKVIKAYNGSSWDQLSNKLTATGGTVTESGGYKIHTFTSSGTFTVTSSGIAEYLVVAGGGGGGGNQENGNQNGGGGGAGGYRSSVSGESSGGGASAESPIALSVGSYTVTVGAGGAGGYRNNGAAWGSDSVFHTITSLKGGRGADMGNQSGGGGSGGGGNAGYPAGAAGTSGQGYAGATCAGYGKSGGGGGGAGGAGVGGDLGTGGIGVASSITGASVYRAGGGGGSASNGGGAAGAGGTGGGGAGSPSSGTDGSPATANTGGGGGGGYGASSGGNGGSGIVIIRYAA
jgi:hypothetical protein